MTRDHNRFGPHLPKHSCLKKQHHWLELVEDVLVGICVVALAFGTIFLVWML